MTNKRIHFLYIREHEYAGGAAAQHRSSREEVPHIQGQGQQPRGVSPRPRSGVVAKRSYPTFKVRSSSCALLEKP